MSVDQYLQWVRARVGAGRWHERWAFERGIVFRATN
jgi:hypothetical protein